MSFKINRLSNTSLVPSNLLAKRSSQISLNYSQFQTRADSYYLKTVPIKNAKAQSFYQKKVIILQSLITLTNIIVFLLTIWQNLNIGNKSKSQISEQNTTIKQDQQILFLYLMTFSILSVIFNFLKIICKINLLSEQKSTTQEQDSHLIQYLPQFIITSILYFIHPSLFTNKITIQFYQTLMPLNKILSCIVYIRLIFILIFFLKLTRFYGLRVKRVLQLYVGDKKDFGIIYSLRCFFKESGLTSPFIIYGILFAILPFFIISVQFKYIQSGSQFSASNAFLQGIYEIMIAMSTIGYGEIRHQYLPQRIVFVFIIIIGSFSSSFLTLTFLDWFKLNQNQQKALRSIRKLSLKNQIKQANNAKIKIFLETFWKLKKKQKGLKQKERKNIQSIFQMDKQPQIQQNQIIIIDQKIKLKQNLPFFSNANIKYTKQKIQNQRDILKDSYEKNIFELKRSIKILIERSLLTNNLMQFYLLRQKNNSKSIKSLASRDLRTKSRVQGSNSTIRSTRRVDDSAFLYQLKLKIIQGSPKQLNSNVRSRFKILSPEKSQKSDKSNKGKSRFQNQKKKNKDQ